jgi:hypothetical protein
MVLKNKAALSGLLAKPRATIMYCRVVWYLDKPGNQSRATQLHYNHCPRQFSDSSTSCLQNACNPSQGQGNKLASSIKPLNLYLRDAWNISGKEDEFITNQKVYWVTRAHTPLTYWSQQEKGYTQRLNRNLSIKGHSVCHNWGLTNFVNIDINYPAKTNSICLPSHL